MSDFGLRCRDASGNIILDTTDQPIRLIKIVDIPANENSVRFIDGTVSSDNSKIFVMDLNNSGASATSFVDWDDRAIPKLYLDNSGNLHCESIGNKGTKPVRIFIFSYI